MGKIIPKSLAGEKLEKNILFPEKFNPIISISDKSPATLNIKKYTKLLKNFNKIYFLTLFYQASSNVLRMEVTPTPSTRYVYASFFFFN